MNDREILLRAIAALFEDDAPRFAYADWLEENGDPRQAEFIRVQLALDRLPTAERERHPLAERELQLWRDLKRWRYIHGDWLALSLSYFHRGFNRVWHGTQSDVIDANNTFWRLGPVCEVTFAVHSKISQGATSGAAVAASGVLRQFTRIAISGRGLTDDWVEAFVQSPNLTRCQSLNLVNSELTDASCQSVARSPLATQGCQFRVISDRVTATGRDLLRIATTREPIV